MVTGMISKKGKRKLVFQDKIYYWYIKKNSEGIPQIHISSEDKTVFLIRYFDSELCIGPQYIKSILAGSAGKAGPGERQSGTGRVGKG